jgi:hypothetical protein
MATRLLSGDSLLMLSHINALGKASIPMLQKADPECDNTRGIVTSLYVNKFVATAPRNGTPGAHYEVTSKGHKALDAARELLLNPEQLIRRHVKPMSAAQLQVVKARAALKRNLYDGGELEAGLGCLRPGCQDFLLPPSRIGDRLHYRDGRVTTLTGDIIHERQAT